MNTTSQLDSALGAINVLAIEAAVDRVYGELRARLERTGRSIGANVSLIAAHAVALGLQWSPTTYTSTPDLTIAESETGDGVVDRHCRIVHVVGVTAVAIPRRSVSKPDANSFHVVHKCNQIANFRGPPAI
jgi:predicted TIM-barrel enzyme